MITSERPTTSSKLFAIKGDPPVVKGDFVETFYGLGVVLSINTDDLFTSVLNVKIISTGEIVEVIYDDITNLGVNVVDLARSIALTKAS